MPASSSDLLKKYKSLFSTTLSVGIGTGTGDTLTPATVTGLPTDTAITITIDRVDSGGTSLGNKVERITGVVSGGNITSYVRAKDSTTEQAHTGGAVIEMVWNAQDWNDMVDWGLVSHTQAGYLSGSSVVASMIAASAVTSGRIAASAVVSGNLAASSVLLTNLAASSVSTGNLNFSPTTTTLATDTLWAAAGDLVKGTGNDTANILTVGSAGAVLNVVSGAPAWTATHKARAYPAGTQAITTGTLTKVTLGTEDYDIGSNFATSTFTAPVTGYYLCSGRVQYDAATAGKRYWCILYHQGTTRKAQSIVTASTNSLAASPSVTDIIYMTASQTLELYTYHDKGSNDTISAGGDPVEAQTAFAVHLISI